MVHQILFHRLVIGRTLSFSLVDSQVYYRSRAYSGVSSMYLKLKFDVGVESEPFEDRVENFKCFLNF